MSIISYVNSVKTKIEQLKVDQQELEIIYKIISEFKTPEVVPEVSEEAISALRYLVLIFGYLKKEVAPFEEMPTSKDKKQAMSYCLAVMLLKSFQYMFDLINENDFKKSVALFYYLAEETPNIDMSEILNYA